MDKRVARQIDANDVGTAGNSRYLLPGKKLPDIMELYGTQNFDGRVNLVVENYLYGKSTAVRRLMRSSTK